MDDKQFEMEDMLRVYDEHENFPAEDEDHDTAFLKMDSHAELP